jgi:hypothetical protein
MRHRSRCGRWAVAVLVAASAAGVTGCSAEASSTASAVKPAKVEKIEGSELKRITLTEKAAQRLDIQTTDVRDHAGQLVMPYAALIYDANGGTWAYTNPEPLVYLREPVAVVRIDADLVVLASGRPAVGTAVVTVGAAELFGTELGLGK